MLVQMMSIFPARDGLIKEFTNILREATRKPSEKFIPIKVQPAHAKLQERTRYPRDWRAA
jgi:dynein heavy chain 1